MTVLPSFDNNASNKASTAAAAGNKYGVKSMSRVNDGLVLDSKSFAHTNDNNSNNTSNNTSGEKARKWKTSVQPTLTTILRQSSPAVTTTLLPDARLLEKMEKSTVCNSSPGHGVSASRGIPRSKSKKQQRQKQWKNSANFYNTFKGSSSKSLTSPSALTLTLPSSSNSDRYINSSCNNSNTKPISAAVANNFTSNSSSSVCSTMTSTSDIDASSSSRPSNTAVYVRDSVYGWLPAQIQSTTLLTASYNTTNSSSDRPSNGMSKGERGYGNDNYNDGLVEVKIVLPEDWAETTVMSDESSISQLEYNLGTHTGLAGTNSNNNTNTYNNTSRNKKRRSYKYEKQDTFSNALPKGITRTVHLSDYPNNELPLQNIHIPHSSSASRHRTLLRRSSLKSSSSNSDINVSYPLNIASDMANLPFLHSPAILYNLKLRHANLLPYTRVGDILVAVNPFTWIDGLYGEEMQCRYALHLIWDVKEEEEEEEGEQKQQQNDIHSHADQHNSEDNALNSANGKNFLHHDSIQEGEEGEEDATTKGGESSTASTTHNTNDEEEDGNTLTTNQSHSFKTEYATLSSLPNNASVDNSKRKPTVSTNSGSGKRPKQLLAHGSHYSTLGFEPHVYEISSLAYRGLAVDRKDQTILVSGESGAGKTETVKIVMGFLATVERTRPFNSFASLVQDSFGGGSDFSGGIGSSYSDYMNMNKKNGEQNETKGKITRTEKEKTMIMGSGVIVQRVLESNPVFEAFGNAKTMRNDNSSRFGRFTQLQFELQSSTEALLFKRKRRQQLKLYQHHHSLQNGTNSENKLPSLSTTSTVPKCLLAGSYCTTYLLEKSRVVCHEEDERSYHIFYQLLAAPNDEKAFIWKEGLLNSNNESFLYIGQTDTDCIEGTSDADNWKHTVEALTLFGFKGESFRTLMRALCVVLQLGNLIFHSAESSAISDTRLLAAYDKDDEGSIISTGGGELKKLSDLIGIPQEDIVKAMTCRISKIRGEEMVVRLRPEDAKDGCDALAKEIYAKIFDVLVRRINEHTCAEKNGKCNVGIGNNDGGGIYGTGIDTSLVIDQMRGSLPPKKHYGSISLLDIFGFERFDVNRFEQLCINYANERLQQRYVLDNFQAVQEEYTAEGIEIFDFTIVDNSDVLNLLEGKLGLIVSLNEECIRPKGSDNSFVYKVKMVHNNSPNLLSDRLHEPFEFGVKHFAGPVTYDATNFLQRNTDLIPQNLLECACKSTNSLIREEFMELLTAANLDKKGAPRRNVAMSKRTVLAKFRQQLHLLMESIESTCTRYIRCIKPNTEMIPRITDHKETMNQLESAGLVTAITISRESFPNRLTYEVTWERYQCLLPSLQIHVTDGLLRNKVHNLLATLLVKPYVRADGAMVSSYACGKTKVYFRAGALERLETNRMAYYSARAISIQNWYRSKNTSYKYILFKKGVVLLQAKIRAYLEQEFFSTKKQAAIIIQCFLRCVTSRMILTQMRKNKAAVTIQSSWRLVTPRRTFLRFRNAALIIQASFRKFKEQMNLNLSLAVSAEKARMDNKLFSIQQQVAEADDASIHSIGCATDDNLKEELETVLEYLSKETDSQREENTRLKSEIRKLIDDNRDLVQHLQSIEAGNHLSRLRAHQLQTTNTSLIAEVMGRKQELSDLRRTAKAKQDSHELELEAMQNEFKLILSKRDEELSKQKQAARIEHTRLNMTIEALKRQLKEEREEHSSEVFLLKEDLGKAKDSHHDYLAKLMDVLETAHTTREHEMQKLAQKLHRVTTEKDKEIKNLKQDISILRAINSAEKQTTKQETTKNHSNMSSMKNKIGNRVSIRQERSVQFASLFQDFGNQAAVPQATHGHRSIIRRRAGADSNATRQAEEVKKLNGIIQSMQELYFAEERSNKEMEIEVIKMLNDVENDSEQRLHQKSLSYFEKTLRSIQNENDILKEKIEEGLHCRACGFRSKRGFGQRAGLGDN